MQVNLTRYDFSNLTIWQAYLQGISLHQVNFAYSSINKSVFTKTFGGIHSIAFSPDGQFYAIADSNAQLRLFRVKDNQQLRLFQVQENHVWIPSVVFSKDGKLLASGGFDQNLILWDRYKGKRVKNFLGYSNCIWSVGWSPDGNTIASGSDDETIKLWDVSTGNSKTLYGHTNGGVWTIAFSPDSQYLVSGGQDGILKIWNVFTGECLHLIV